MEASKVTTTHGATIKALAVGPFKTLTKIAPAGALQVRKGVTGAASFYWRYSFGSHTERVLIGDYDSSAPPKSLEPTNKGYSVMAAIEAAKTLAQEHKKNIADGGRPALLQAKAKAKAEAAEAKERAKEFTLKSLLTQYCDLLESLGRRSHKDARSIFKLHVMEAWPKLAASPANEISPEQVANMMRKCIEAGKGRTANKLRSYMQAAYKTAKASRTKPSIPVAFTTFNITSNPAADTEPDQSQNKADKNPLTLLELRKYWNTIKQMEGFKGSILRLHLLTGGQRIEQLVNLRTADTSESAILIYDGKGRPGKPPRPHYVPLIAPALIALMECQPQGEFALSTDKGITHVAATTFSAWAKEAPHKIEEFNAKRLRSSVETELARAKVSVSDRGRLQSHGISGVQSTNYDAYDYLDEKRHSLDTLWRILEAPESSKIVHLRSA